MRLSAIIIKSMKEHLGIKYNPKKHDPFIQSLVDAIQPALQLKPKQLARQETLVEENLKLKAKVAELEKRPKPKKPKNKKKPWKPFKDRGLRTTGEVCPKHFEKKKKQLVPDNNPPLPEESRV